MYLTVKQQLKHLTKQEYKMLREQCRYAKNLKNQALYEIRQEYFTNKKHLNYCAVDKRLKNSENYKMIQANVSQQILKAVDKEFKGFFGSIKSKKVNHKVSIPHYLPKDGYAQLIIQMVNIKDGCLIFPMSNTYKKTHNKFVIKIPTVLADKQVKMVKIKPKHNARYFEISYCYKAEENSKVELDKTKALAIDLGVNNFCTCATSDGETFILDGKKLKSYNQWYNKENARLSSIKDKQKFGKGITNRQVKLLEKRENRIRNFVGKTAKRIIKYCLENKIGNLVVGKNKDFQENSNMGKKNNQVFVNIPYGKLVHSLKYQCELFGINFVEQEESYTSKASFWDRDEITVYSKENRGKYTFSGKRIHRGLYRTKDGRLLNADVNGALNILRKSNVVSLETLYSRGELSTPVRIRVA